MSGNPTIESDPAPADIQFLEDQITAYNFDQTGIRDGKVLASFVRNDAGQIVAGIYGWTWGGCCEVRYLWVARELRGRGHGSRLLAAVEEVARGRGCTQVVLDTHSFQAPGFYQKYGYQVAGMLENYPRGERKFWFIKSLT